MPEESAPGSNDPGFLFINVFLDNGGFTGILEDSNTEVGGCMPKVIRIEISKEIADKARPMLKRNGLTLTSYVRVKLLDFIGGIETPINNSDQAESDISSLM